MRYFLGLDGGGSKCSAVLLDETGAVLGWGKSGPTTYQSEADAEASCRESLDAAVARTTPAEIAEIWAGELGHTSTAWLEQQGICVHSVTVGENTASLLAALQDHGVVVHAGTGSFVSIRAENGRTLHFGGFGPVVGEDGAGWDIGLRGIKAGLRSSWTAETRTRLAEVLPPVLGLSDIRQVMGRPIYTGQISRARVAALAPVVIAEAEAGDRIALRVLHEAAETLAEIGRLGLTEAGIIGRGAPLIGIAGVIQGSPFYWRILRDKMLRHDPSLKPMVPPVRMCVGAAFRAMRQSGIPLTAELRERVVATQKHFPGAAATTCE